MGIWLSVLDLQQKSKASTSGVAWGFLGVGGDVVVGAGSVLVVKGDNIGDGVRRVGVGPIGEEASAEGRSRRRLSEKHRCA